MEIMSHEMWLYFRFRLSFRDVEELLLERGVTVTYEAIRSGVANLAKRMPLSSGGAAPSPGTSGISMKVRHERIARVLECDAVQKMREDPSAPACRNRRQTTSSCSGKESLW